MYFLDYLLEKKGPVRGGRVNTIIVLCLMKQKMICDV